jgi:predicted DNA-binding transcriptional regulator YafY
MVQLTFRASAAAVALVLGYGGEARLLEPAQLRAEVFNRASAALTAHAPQRNE